MKQIIGDFVCNNENVNTNENKIQQLLNQYEILKNEYDVVCTNPPYMGKKNINQKLRNFLEQEYPDTKSEMYAAFIERCLDFTKQDGYLAMITIHSWMFISSFTKLRKRILESGTIMKMLHTGAATFDDLNSKGYCKLDEDINSKRKFIQTIIIRQGIYSSLENATNIIFNIAQISQGVPR